MPEQTRYTGRVRAKKWTCQWCGTENSGEDRECSSCGHPRDESVTYRSGEGNRILTGEEAKSKMTGPDWLCACCDTYNSSTKSTCSSCGAPKGAAPDYFEVQRKKKEEAEIRRRQEMARQMQQETEDAHEQIRRIQQKKPDSMRKIANFQAIGAIAALLCGIGFFVWLMVFMLSPTAKPATVDDVQWSSSMSLQEFQTLQDEGWDAPSGARILKTERRYKETVQEIDHYRTEKQPVTKYRTVQDEDRVWYTWEDMGNGYEQEVEHREPQSHQEPYTEYEDVRVPVYRDVAVYDDWKWYEYDKWVTLETRTESGNKGEEHDPQFDVKGDKQRTTEPSRTYWVDVTVPGSESKSKDGKPEQHRITVSKEIYDRLEPGSEVTIETNRAGSVKITQIDGDDIK